MMLTMSSLVRQQQTHQLRQPTNQLCSSSSNKSPDEQSCYSIELAADSSSPPPQTSSASSSGIHDTNGNNNNNSSNRNHQRQHEAIFASSSNNYVYSTQAFEQDNNNISMLQVQQQHHHQHHHQNLYHQHHLHDSDDQLSYNQQTGADSTRLQLNNSAGVSTTNQTSYRPENNNSTTSADLQSGLVEVQQQSTRLCSYNSEVLSESSHLSPDTSFSAATANQPSLYSSGLNHESPATDLNQHHNLNHNNQHHQANHHNHNHNHNHHNHHHHEASHQTNTSQQQHYLSSSLAADGCCEPSQYMDTCYDQRYGISEGSFYDQQLQLSSYSDLIESNHHHQQQHSPNNNYQGSDYVGTSNGVHELAIESQHQYNNQQHQQISSYHSNQHPQQYSSQLISHNYQQHQQQIGEACSGQQSMTQHHHHNQQQQQQQQQQHAKQQQSPTSDCNQSQQSNSNNNNNNYGQIVVEDGLGYTSLQQLSLSCELNYSSSDHQVSTTSSTPKTVGQTVEKVIVDSKRSSIKGRRGRPRKKGSRSKNKVNGKLWEFIRDLLLNERTNPSFIRWERREDGVFKFVQSDKVAKMWGERKQNPKMTYEKLSRAMRYYYKSKVLLPVFGRRLVYKFGPNATGWLPETNDSAHLTLSGGLSKLI